MMKNQCLRNCLYSRWNCHIPFGFSIYYGLLQVHRYSLTWRIACSQNRSNENVHTYKFLCTWLQRVPSWQTHSPSFGLVGWSWLSPPLRMVAAQLRTMMSPLSTRPPRSSPPVWSLFSSSFLFQYFTPHLFQALIFGNFWVNVVEICKRYLYTVSFFSCLAALYLHIGDGRTD